MIEIEKGIPMAAPHKRKYPFREMEVGDSFRAPDALRSVSSYNTWLRPKHFVIRIAGDGSRRVWRDK